MQGGSGPQRHPYRRARGEEEQQESKDVAIARGRRERRRGVVLTGNRAAEIREFPAPQVGPGEAVVKRRASGLCGTDLHRSRAAGPTAMMTGYEPCGVMVALGPGSPDGLTLGARVLVHHDRGCGVCDIGAMGSPRLCARAVPRITHRVAAAARGRHRGNSAKRRATARPLRPTIAGPYWPYRTVAVGGPHVGAEPAPGISLLTFGTGHRP